MEARSSDPARSHRGMGSNVHGNFPCSQLRKKKKLISVPTRFCPSPLPPCRTAALQVQGRNCGGKREVQCRAPTGLGVRTSLARSSPGSGERKGREEVRRGGGGKRNERKTKWREGRERRGKGKARRSGRAGEARRGTGEAASGEPPEPGALRGSRRSRRGALWAADLSFRGEGQGAGEGRKGEGDSSGIQG